MFVQSSELSTWQRRVSEMSSRLSELEDNLSKAQKELIKAQDTNSKLQRDLRENVAQKEDQVFHHFYQHSFTFSQTFYLKTLGYCCL